MTGRPPRGTMRGGGGRGRGAGRGPVRGGGNMRGGPIHQNTNNNKNVNHNTNNNNNKNVNHHKTNSDQSVFNDMNRQYHNTPHGPDTHHNEHGHIVPNKNPNNNNHNGRSSVSHVNINDVMGSGNDSGNNTRPRGKQVLGGQNNNQKNNHNNNSSNSSSNSSSNQQHNGHNNNLANHHKNMNRHKRQAEFETWLTVHFPNRDFEGQTGLLFHEKGFRMEARNALKQSRELSVFLTALEGFTPGAAKWFLTSVMIPPKHNK